jgi:hypothetical protein
MAVKIQVEVLWVATPQSVVVGNRRFGGTCYSLFTGEMKLIWRKKVQQILISYLTLHGVTTQKTST